jgi:hypothetical protein
LVNRDKDENFQKYDVMVFLHSTSRDLSDEQMRAIKNLSVMEEGHFTKHWVINRNYIRIQYFLIIYKGGFTG